MFEAFNVEAHESGACIYDHVEVSFDSFSWKFCGQDFPGPFVSSGPSMTVRFHSDKFDAESGFLAKWEEISGKEALNKIKFLHSQILTI